jgi:cytochrome c-type biogenesis protein CcmH
MMGWLMLALLGACVAALFAWLRMPRIVWPLAGSALMLGAAGYAWQGAPGLPSHMVAADAVKLPPDPRYKALRDTFFGRFGGESIYFGVSDAALGSGNTRVAARVLAGGVDYAPKNAAMWTELGNVIALHDEGNMSPAALLAYRQAMLMAPTHPGPPFFLALSYLRAGDLKQGRVWLAHALALTPKDASYRDEIAVRLAALDRIMKLQSAR